ncbi:ABC transporter permease [Cupriavidus cauae]|uniref:ABC transporter permease n=1 Tax=Cupriavidus cauae TaxID=2608999 RepID=UPI0022441843|nr:ABC transporter permease [Cupriavidus cauae]UZN50264.1 ABC transporter permease [Cupriavidus cauae]
MQKFSVVPREVFATIWRNRHLIGNLIRREIMGRYRGSMLGILWSLFHPLLMLAVYTFVFSVVFKARWSGGSESKGEFALVLFSGLMIFTVFAECVSKAPSLIVGNANYVKKVIFPLEILPVVAFGAACFHAAISFVVWIVFYIAIVGMPSATILYLPLVLLPLAFFTLGISWFLASLGVYLRDVTHITSILTSVLMFLTPIFYPISVLPEQFQRVLYINPLSGIVEQARNVMMWGQAPQWHNLGILAVSGAAVGWLGFAWFQRTRKGFSDVL